jgi:hypothetical protein
MVLYLQRKVGSLGIARYLLSRIYDLAYRGEEIDEDINKLEKLIDGAVAVFVHEHGVDVKETALNFYLINIEPR